LSVSTIWKFTIYGRALSPGRRSAVEFLTAHAVDLGARATLDIDDLLVQV
jgi:hypothetical protein